MQRSLLVLVLAIFIFSQHRLSAQCITLNAPQFTVLSGQTVDITPSHPNIIHVCGNSVAYDTSGAIGREYHLDPGSSLFIKNDSLTVVFMKATSVLDHMNDPATIAINYEVSSTLSNIINSLLLLCPLITFPQASCTMGIDEFTAKEGLHLYPNPAGDELQLFYNGHGMQLKAEITDQLGRVVDVVTLEMHKASVYSTAKLEDAVYFVTVKDGEKILEKKKLIVVR